MNFLVDCSGELLVIVRLFVKVVDLIKFGIPFLLIIFGLIDLGKAVMAGKEDEMKSAQKLLIKRVIYAVVAFLIINIVVFAFDMIGQGNDSDWYECYDQVRKGK